MFQVSGKIVQVHLKSESLLSKTDLTVQRLVSHDSSFVVTCDLLNTSLTPVRGRALSDLLESPTDKCCLSLPTLEPIKIQSAEVADEESSESEPEDDANLGMAKESDNDSEPEADRDIPSTWSNCSSAGESHKLSREIFHYLWPRGGGGGGDQS